MSIQKRIFKWNLDRNITSIPYDNLVVNCLLEELFEFLGINKAMPKNEFKKIVNTYAGYIINEARTYNVESTIEEKIDALCDMNVFSDGFIWRYGYDPSIAMDETLKEIESRTGSMSEEGKWIKSDATYAADYSVAKLCV
ncbi:MAG: hypothetical protein JHC33_14640 [Ignisphaera sp.]|nr:hypothetical protein [Ignisphaera sp.]